MKFSIITPVTYDTSSPDELRMPRHDMFLRCANSVFGQVNTDYEWIIVDDIAKPPIEEVLEENDSWWNPKGLKVKVVRLPEKSGRMIARNAGMKAATGDWICWLDADDEFASTYLSSMADAIRLHPDKKIFNFNHLIFGYDYKVHERRFINMDIQKDLPFPSGVVGAGSYIFHKDVYKDIGPLPPLSLWDFAEKAFEEFPEIKSYFLKPGSKDEYNSLGNPWGEDYYYFYKMTRKYKSHYLDAAPYYVHSRWGHRWADDPDYVVDPGKPKDWNAKDK